MKANISQKEIQKLIAKETAKATTIAALPIPILDMVGVVFIQVRLLEKLADAYGVNIDKKQKLIFSSVISTVLLRLTTEIISSVAAKTKIDQILGQSMIEATVTGLITGALGEIYNLHFKNGGEVENVNFDSLLKYLQFQVAADKLSVDHISKKLVTSIAS